MKNYILKFKETNRPDWLLVGRKNATLGEMFQHLSHQGVKIPDGFSITVDAYWDFLNYNYIKTRIGTILTQLDRKTYSNLAKVGRRIRQLILDGDFSYSMQVAILAAYDELKERTNSEISLAVRSSAVAKDLPGSSFARQQESYLNIVRADHILDACRHCYASLFSDRAIKYREFHGLEHMKVGLSIGIQKMVRSDIACSGIGAIPELNSGCRKEVVINGAWGLDGNGMKGTVDCDKFIVSKTGLQQGTKSIYSKTLGTKLQMMIYTERNRVNDFSTTTFTINTPVKKRNQYVLGNEEIKTLARWGMMIEEYYKQPINFEWAKDGTDGQLYIVQARQEKNNLGIYQKNLKI